MPLTGGLSGGKTMSDWLTHSLVGWIVGKITRQDVGLVVIGALLPDVDKFYLVVNGLFNIHSEPFFLPLHTPIGALLLAGTVAVLFTDIKRAFISLGVGVTTHFVLDIVFFEIGGGIRLLFPFSWEGWQLNLIPMSDYELMITVYAVAVSAVVYSLYYVYGKRKMRLKKL
jgi:hypothetical protein